MCLVESITSYYIYRHRQDPAKKFSPNYGMFINQPQIQNMWHDSDKNNQLLLILVKPYVILGWEAGN